MCDHGVLDWWSSLHRREWENVGQYKTKMLNYSVTRREKGESASHHDTKKR